MLWLDMFDDIGNSIYAGDGIRQAEESPLAGYTVELYKADDTDNAIASTTTGADGKYSFTNIEPGSYVVGVKTTTMDGVEYLLPLFWLDGTTGDNRFVATYDASADAYLYAYTAPITVAEDSEITGMDAGMRTVPETQTLAGPYDAEINLTDGTVTGNSTGITVTASLVTFDVGTENKNYRIYGTTTARRVSVSTGIETNITLDGASITIASQSPFTLNGATNVNLTLEGTNVLNCTYAGTTTGTGYAGLSVATSATLTITEGSTGSLQAQGGNYGAGIGSTSAWGTPNGTVIINGGTISATGGIYAAGIGGGIRGDGGTITINGGTITAGTARSGVNGVGAGIGGGGSGGAGYLGGSGGIITINGGTITANGGTRSAGIGGGGNTGSGNNGGGAGTITITGGRITATGGLNNTTGDIYFAPGIGGSVGGNGEIRNITGTVIFTGGSILPKNMYGVISVLPNPTNGSNGAPDPVGLITFGGYSSGDAFYLTAGGTVSSYPYNAIAHPDGNVYAWLTYPGVRTDAATAMSTTAASVTAPSTVNSAASSTATLNGSYYLNNTSPVTQARFEWGTTTSYGTTIDMTSSINTTETATAVRTLSPPALTGLIPGTTYHYRLVIVTSGITVRGNDVTFTPPALVPSVDVIHDYPGGTTATLDGIYDLNGGTFVSGEFEISDDGGSTWSTPTGGTLTGSTTMPSVTLTGLTPGTTYHYRLTVTNSEGATTTVMQELTVSAKTVTISNEVTGAYANMDKSFTYTIYFQDSGGTALASGTQFTYTGGVIAGSGATAPSGATLTLGSGGEATVTLTTGQTITIAGIATSAKVRVVQSTDANYTTSFKDSLDASFTSGADTGVRNMTAADRTFDFTNTRSVVPGGISTGSGGIVLLSLMALLALAADLTITAVHRRRAGAR